MDYVKSVFINVLNLVLNLRFH